MREARAQVARKAKRKRREHRRRAERDRDRKKRRVHRADLRGTGREEVVRVEVDEDDACKARDPSDAAERFVNLAGEPLDESEMTEEPPHQPESREPDK